MDKTVSSLNSDNASNLTPLSGCQSLHLLDSFIDAANSSELYQRLQQEQAWPANTYQVFDRCFTLPRLQTWHADAGIVYRYSNNLLQARPWTELITTLKNQVEKRLERKFNAVLVNYYRDGSDYVGWHSDDEVELGDEPLIASLSLGAERTFAYRRKVNHDQEATLQLTSGSLLVMEPDFQRHYEHSVPPVEQAAGRINLTFRYVISPSRAIHSK